ncbi:MAG: S1 RNA-binding domain-containing protein [Polyangiaceae bacterium]|nr:S1 RNA-binding domain-containing protein [Polyangiaceae bacterium]
MTDVANRPDGPANTVPPSDSLVATELLPRNEADSSPIISEGPTTDKSPTAISEASHRLLLKALVEPNPEVVEHSPESQDRIDEFCIRPELLHLVDLTAKYPEIGPPLAQLAFKMGQNGIGNQIVRMGLGKEGPGLEYYFVVANLARREQRFAEARALSVEAINTFVRTPNEELASDDGVRLLHLIRLGYATLLFNEKDIKGDPVFVEQLREALPSLELRLFNDAFYQTLVAETRWFDDPEASEAAWERAAELDPSDTTWNARGTWYKDAEKDLNKAEYAYRRGLQQAPSSPLLLHNLGQLLVDKAELPSTDVNKAFRMLNEAHEYLRSALREESPKGLRRHIHSTIERLISLRGSLPPRGQKHEEPPAPPPEREPVAGDVFKGRVKSIAAFGAFVILPERGVGLLHKSEIAHEFVEDPGHILKVDQEIDVKVMDVARRDGKLRIALSRKALIPQPDGFAPPAHQSPSGRQPRDHQRDQRDHYREHPPQAAHTDQDGPAQGQPRHDQARTDQARHDQARRDQSRPDHNRQDPRDRRNQGPQGQQQRGRGPDPKQAAGDSKLITLGEMIAAKFRPEIKT